MCGPGGKSEEVVGPPINSVNIELQRPQSSAPPRPRTAARPTTGADRDRPRTKHRSHTSSGDPRPKTHHRTESRQRPEGSSAGGRRTSHRESHTRGGGRSRREPIITEHQHTEDRRIHRHLTELGAFIDNHVSTFYNPIVEAPYSGVSEDLDDTRTREPALRKFIIQRVIEDIAMGSRDSTIAHEIADELEVYANSNSERTPHLESICNIGSKLRADLENHTSRWEFGSMEEPGYIVMVPALFKDGSEVVASQMFRVD